MDPTLEEKRFRTTPPHAEGGSVLLIDDSPLLLDVVSEVLSKNEWMVETASSGTAGIEKARLELPDVVVCDLNMPEMNGVQVMTALHDIDSDIPVIMLSGDEELDSVLGAVRQGAFDYVTKSKGYAEALLAAVDRAHEHVRLLRENARLTDVVRRANVELAKNLSELDRQHQLLAEAQKRSESLLRNVLPDAIAERLQAEEQDIADGFANVTVLFADLVGFAELSSQRTPKELLTILNEIFTAFDRLAIKRGIEKIKTIGDGYMAASGLPIPREDHAEVMAAFAFDMCVAIASKTVELNVPLHLRIGMHSGPVVAGIVGESKFAYDLWGDTVNYASRMESYGVPDRIHVSEECAELLRPWCNLESRGLVDLKGYGQRPTYFLQEFKDLG